MNRPTLFVALVTIGLIGSACGKKDQDPQSIPVGSASAATVAADNPTAAAADAAAPPPVTPPVVTTTPPKTGGNIDGCCAGIAAVKKSGKDAVAKSHAASAALVCPGISKQVTAGTVTRSAALVQIKSLLQGVTVPECN